MKDFFAYERFPMSIVLLSNALTIAIYAIGLYMLAQCGIWWAALYLLYCGWMEIRLLRFSCVNCYYYDNVCAFGKGKLCARLFKQGDPQKFAEKECRWLDLLPDFLVMIFPLIGGIVLLITDFSWIILVLLIVLLGLSSAGNAFIRGSYACKYCKQKELGCPAEKLFNKKPMED
jgi:hypothetical protein